ncbi:ABC transporter ATP-binding protein [Phytohabitans sp. ZYX-F-186]|uniref:ABC transporter ATP-binding protein n=1 Tax=Phytohabitans maris TaxID=3071409 RepID=A0ABU0ZBH2_9ACTN|nr:ABC transporter ATP-binding protein [Phytohabitans sp. ZYX-F-186]MDQ7903680.1 ABC transporter ATP-binding protein [Phytohabitans sp. ZYX-F-186]
MITTVHNTPDGEPVLRVRGLTAVLDLPTGPATALHELDFDIGAGEILGVVGESGSGKSLTSLAVMRMLPDAARVTAGQILLHGEDLLTKSEKDMRRLRGRHLGIVFQDPLAYLHPLKRVGAQLRESLTVHAATRAQAATRALELLKLVGIPDAEQRIDDYPHQFSGGMRQRVMIAMAVAHNPSLLIADEPTTALDVTIQAEILRVLVRLRDELGTAVMLITHDIGVVEDTCDRVLVMYAGRIAEQAGTGTLLKSPRHPYTRELLRSVPHLNTPLLDRLPAIPGQPPDPRNRPAGCPFHDRCPDVRDRCTREMPPLERVDADPGHSVACWVAPDTPVQIAAPAGGERRTGRPETEVILSVEDVRVWYTSRRWPWSTEVVPAVDGVTFQARQGTAVGLVGESGCGKSTLAKAILGLQPVTSGRLTVAGREWSGADSHQRAALRRTVQMVFQDPYASLNPRMTVGDSIAEPLRNYHLAGRSQLAGAVRELLDQVGLPARYADSYPYQLSGGQRQRVGIARALAVSPKLIVADEPVSALDVSVQAQVINLFDDLRDRTGVGYVFITHDLAVARHMCDDILVMYAGRIVESGPASAIFANPSHPYTRTLLASAPGSGLTKDTGLKPASGTRPTGGCRFRDRCPVGPAANPQRTVCAERDPALDAVGPRHHAACHFAERDDR